MPETTYEMLAREKKATALAAVLLKYRVSPDVAKRFSATDWMTAAAHAQCQMPSQATKDLVIRMLEEKP